MIFGGHEDADEDMRANYAMLEASCQQFPKGLLQTLFIHPGNALPAGLWKGETLLDPLGASHARYGAESECLYLIRPDGYVGYRALPPTWAPLSEHLSRVFGN